MLSVAKGGLICALCVCVEVWICTLSGCQCVFKCVDTTRKALQSVRMVGCSPEGRVDRNSLIVNENCEGKVHLSLSHIIM